MRSPSSPAKSLTGTERATRYMADVASGKQLACKWTKLACARQQRDLKRKKWLYHFDAEHANAVVNFIEALPHVKGRQFAGKPLILSDWQCFIITAVFGWLNAAGLRRFRTVYIEVPRKNGKSTMTAPVGLFLLAADGEPGAEVYSAATVRDQAKIIWGDARTMVQRCAPLRRALDVHASAHSIYVPSSNSSFKPLSRDQQGNLDGLNVHGGLIDELHGHKDRNMWDVIETGTGARSQPLVWSITTAGSNKTGICYEQHVYLTKLLDQLYKDETYFGIIYTIDKGDDEFAVDTWRKANPNFGVSVMQDDLERKATKAKQMSAAMSNFKTKHLNVWVNADNPWMNMLSWQKCKSDRPLEDFDGANCVLACDLATKTDIAAKIKLFEYEGEDGRTNYHVFCDFWLPRTAIDEARNEFYEIWSDAGWLTLVPGGATDFRIIEDSIKQDFRHHNVVDAVFDPWQAAQMIQNLTEDGFLAAEYRQTVQNMSTPMKELEAMVIDGRLHHDGNPVLEWMVSNVVCHSDVKDNIYPRKQKSSDKIDGAVALIMAIGRSMLQQDDAEEFSQFLRNPVVL